MSPQPGPPQDLPPSPPEAALEQGPGFWNTPVLCEQSRTTFPQGEISECWVRAHTQEPPPCQREQVTKQNLLSGAQRALTLPEDGKASLILLELSHTRTLMTALHVISYRNVSNV